MLFLSLGFRGLGVLVLRAQRFFSFHEKCDQGKEARLILMLASFRSRRGKMALPSPFSFLIWFVFWSFVARLNSRGSRLRPNLIIPLQENPKLELNTPSQNPRVTVSAANIRPSTIFSNPLTLLLVFPRTLRAPRNTAVPFEAGPRQNVSSRTPSVLRSSRQSITPPVGQLYLIAL